MYPRGIVLICSFHSPGQGRVCLCTLSLCRLLQQAACISQQPLLQPLPGLQQPLPLRVQQRCLLHPAGKCTSEQACRLRPSMARAATVLRSDHSEAIKLFCQTNVKSQQGAARAGSCERTASNAGRIIVRGLPQLAIGRRSIQGKAHSLHLGTEWLQPGHQSMTGRASGHVIRQCSRLERAHPCTAD